MGKKGYDYFRAFTKMVEGSMAAAILLDEILNKYNKFELDAHINKMHKIENANDELVHEILNHLIKEFLPPIEREDISLLTQQLDEPTDTAEDVLFALYMFNIDEIIPEAVEFSKLIVQAVDVLYEASRDFVNFKKDSKTVKEKIIRVNEIEGKGDQLYIQTMRKIYTSDMDAKDVMKWTRIINKLENCLDTLEKCSNEMEFIMMKNI